MSTLVKPILKGMALWLLVAPTALFAMHTDMHPSRPAFGGFSNDTASDAWSNHSQPATCNLTQACPGKSRRSRPVICLSDKPCIPLSPAWSPNGPRATKSQKPGGFPGLDAPAPTPIPTPMSGLLLASALTAIGLASRRQSRRHRK